MKPTDNTTSCTRRIMQTLAVCAGVLIVGACSTTKRIPEGEQLYTGIKKIDITAPEGDKVPEGVAGQITEAVGVPPNNAIFKSPKYRWPFPVGLWVYNNWDDPGKGIKHWLYDKLVSEPVLVSDVRPQIRTRMVDEILDNNGYFRGNASYETIDQKDPKKAKISYTIKTGPAYTLDSIGFLPDTCLLNHLIDSIAMRDPYLRAGERYSTDSLSAVRTRITNKLRNRGFYFFRPDYIEYLADSIAYPGEIELKMMLASNTPSFALQPYTTGKVTVHVARNQGGGRADTVEMQRATLIQMMPSRLRRKLIDENVTFRPGRRFSVRSMDRTQANLARLGIFNNINIEAVPDTNDLAAHKLNVDVYATFDTPLETSLEVNASSKSNSYIGPGLTFGVTNKNIFGGGEQLSVKLTGTYEWQTGRGRRGNIFQLLRGWPHRLAGIPASACAKVDSAQPLQPQLDALPAKCRPAQPSALLQNGAVQRLDQLRLASAQACVEYPDTIQAHLYQPDAHHPRVRLDNGCKPGGCTELYESVYSPDDVLLRLRQGFWPQQYPQLAVLSPRGRQRILGYLQGLWQKGRKRAVRHAVLAVHQGSDAACMGTATRWRQLAREPCRSGCGTCLWQ